MTTEQLKIIISAETEKLKKGVADAKAEIDKLTSKSKLSSKDIDDNFKKMGKAAADAGKIIAKGLAVGAAALTGLVVATKDYRTQQAQLKTAFEAAGGSAETATQVYNDLYRVLGEGDTATEAANLLSQLTTNEKELAQWTTVCQGVYATFPDSLPIEGLVEASNETAKTGVVTGTLADAINWAKASNEDWQNALSGNKGALDAFNSALESGATKEEAFNAALAACNTEAEREALIRNTLNGLYGEAAAMYEKNAADVLAQNEAQAKLQASLAAVATALAPLITAFMTFGAEALAIVVPYIQQIAEEYGPQLQTVLEGLTVALQSAFEWASQHKELLAAIGVAILIVVAAITAYNVVAAIKKAMDVAEVATVWALVAAYTAKAAAILASVAIYALIIAAIVGFVAILVKAYKENETFRAIVDKVFNNIKDIISSVMEIVKSIISTVWAVIKTIWDGGLKQILTVVITILARVVETFTTKLNTVLTFVSTVIKAVSNVIKSNLETAKTIVKNVIGLIKAIFTGDFGAAKQAVVNILNAIVNNFKAKLNSAKSIVKGAINAIKGFFNFKWSLPKLKMPSIKITGKFSLNPPSAPKFRISWNKLGGVFDKPTLFNYAGSLQGLGEDGAEAVVPLEKNTKWLDVLAEKISAKQGNQPVILQVDGKTFAQVSIDSINALTRQRGKLGLNIV